MVSVPLKSLKSCDGVTSHLAGTNSQTHSPSWILLIDDALELEILMVEFP